MKLSLFGSDGTPGLAKRVLGPSADVIGDTLARWTELRTQNVGRVLESADRKLGDRRNEPGSVPPRVAARILDEGSYCDDHVMVEYLGGVLASARTPIGRDDRAAKWATLVTSLSVYEVRMHYLLYACMRETYRAAFADQSVEWTDAGKFSSRRVVVGHRDLVAAMDFDETEPWEVIVPESIITLHRDGLVGDQWWMRGEEGFEEKLKLESPADGAMCVFPSMFGIQLWMWAHGVGDKWDEWTTVDVGERLSDDVAPPPGELLSDMQKRAAAEEAAKRTDDP